MNKAEIYKAYKMWAKGKAVLSEEELFQHTVGNQDLYEDDLVVINRLNYLVVEFSNGRARYFSFYELNTFHKDALEDLQLSSSEWKIDQIR